MDAANNVVAADIYKAIKLEWETFQSNNNKVRIRDAANQLGTSEASLLSTEIDKNTLFLNIDNYNHFITKILSIDKIMLLVRNNSVVHEKTITTIGVELKEDKIIDNNTNSPILEFDSAQFQYVFYQKKTHAGRSLRSFQIFDRFGDAIVKIYLKGKDKLKFDKIVNQYKSDYKYQLQNPPPSQASIQRTPKGLSINFLKKIEKNKIHQYDSDGSTLRKIISMASKTKTPIQIHAIGSKTIQYHRDLVNKVVDFGPWINIMDKSFNLHVIENDIKKTTINEYKIKNDIFYLIDFYDKLGNYVLGICSLKLFNKDFNKMINKINQPIKQEI